MPAVLVLIMVLSVVFVTGRLSDSETSGETHPPSPPADSGFASDKTSRTVGGPLVSPVAGLIDTGDVLLATAAGSLYALDSQSGDIVWKGVKASVPPRSQSIAAGEELAAVRESGLTVVSLVDGSRQWSVDVGILGQAPVVVGPVIILAGSVHPAGGPAPAIAAHDIRDGLSLWRVEPAGWELTEPVVQGGVLVIGLDSGGSQDGLLGLDPTDGSTLWRTDLHDAPLLVAGEGGDVFIATDSGRVLGVDPRTGNIEWTTTDVHSERPILLTASGPVVALIVGGGGSSVIQLYDRDSGRRLAGSATDGEITAAAASAGLLVYAVVGGELKAVTTSGARLEEAWSTNLTVDVGPVSAVALGSETSRALIGTQDGGVVALDATTGRLVWHRHLAK